MKTSFLSITALVIGFGLISPLTVVRASAALQRIGQAAQNSSFVLAQETERPSPEQLRQSAEDVRRSRQQNNFEQQRQQQQDAQRRQQQDFFEQRRQQQQDAQRRQQQDRFEQRRQQQQNIFEQQRQQQDAQRRQQQDFLEQRRQQQQNIFEQRRQQQDAQRRQQQDFLEQRRQQQQQDAQRRQRQDGELERQRQNLQTQYQRQIDRRRDWATQYNRQLARQRLAWQRDRDRSDWLQQQKRIERERRLDRIAARHRRLYRDYVTYYHRDYWQDYTWRNRNYWDDSSYWSGPGYWYERNYWSQRGYLWDDILGVVLQVLIGGLGQGSTYSDSPYPRASALYDEGPEILAVNGLTQAACEPGNIVILLPNQRVMCALPTYAFAPGTYRINRSDLSLVPADIQY
jgi:hypothetical protein